jgi:hypothetical protein
MCALILSFTFALTLCTDTRQRHTQPLSTTDCLKHSMFSSNSLLGLASAVNSVWPQHTDGKGEGQQEVREVDTNAGPVGVGGVPGVQEVCNDGEEGGCHLRQSIGRKCCYSFAAWLLQTSLV